MKTFEQIRELLAQKFSLEKKRLMSYGTKISSYDMANAVARSVQALMTESRRSELKRLFKKCGEEEWFQPVDYVRERLHATKVMVTALQNEAEKTEKARPWKRKVEKEKHEHRSKHRR